MSSDYDTYGVIKVKSVYADEAGFRLFNSSDNTKYCELKANAPSGQHVLTLANETGTLLTSASTLDGAKLDINGETVVDAINNSDEFLLFDASASANKKVSAEALAVFCGASGGLPVGTTGQLVVYDAVGDAQAVSMSSGATLNATGQLTVADNSITNAMLQGSIAYGKLS